jgi:hypothetical protein
MEGEPDLEDLDKVNNAKDYAKILDAQSSLVEYYPETDTYITGNKYYFSFE